MHKEEELNTNDLIEDIDINAIIQKTVNTIEEFIYENEFTLNYN